MPNLVHTSRTEKALEDQVIKLSKQYTALEKLRVQGTVTNVTLQDVQDALLDGVHALKAVETAYRLDHEEEVDPAIDPLEAHMLKVGQLPPLKPEWCRCADQEGDIIYPQDGECSCPIEKHHVHRLACGHVTQVG